MPKYGCFLIFLQIYLATVLGYTKPEIASIFGVTVRTIERDLAKNKKNDEQRFCDIP